ncbi:hypothetical protein PRUPE_5G038100 [Prunus persica]|uniref:Uncharacterized protein n=1 Tax=Prunus persica TaxID=3760 RepID=A0A251P3B8_PRUPE|nr:hypothetical protein PRUPE_5G038100 [Prunus persica]
MVVFTHLSMSNYCSMYSNTAYFMIFFFSEKQLSLKSARAKRIGTMFIKNKSTKISYTRRIPSFISKLIPPPPHI